MMMYYPVPGKKGMSERQKRGEAGRSKDYFSDRTFNCANFTTNDNFVKTRVSMIHCLKYTIRTYVLTGISLLVYLPPKLTLYELTWVKII